MQHHVVTITLNGSGNREAIVVETRCRRVTLREKSNNPTYPTSDYEVSDSQDPADDAAIVQAGAMHTIHASAIANGHEFHAGETIGYAALTIVASADFDQIEET